jgi:UrcA family protein
MTLTNSKTSLCVAIAALSFLSSAALAADGYVLTYSEPELNTVPGMQNVHQRIVRVAKNYCPSYSQIKSHTAVKTCVDGVVQDLVGKIENGNFQAFVNQRDTVGEHSIAGLD